ncbi:MAG: DUF502 domain-containing protein [Myxococcota bacterium]
MDEREAPRDPLRTHLRKTMLAGLVFSVPLVVTAWVLVTLFNTVDEWLGPALAKATGWEVPGLGVLVTIALVYALGLFAQNVAGQRLIHLWDSLVTRVPLVRGVYKATKEVSQAFGREQRPFRAVVAAEFPRKGIWTLGFVTADAPAGVAVPKGSVFVFIPTTPNPTSGWLILLPQEELLTTPYSVEEGMRIIISAGIVSPSQPPR